jgi:putative ABC transport system permease protein
MRGERLIRLLLRLYPRTFRTRYGDAMLDFHRARVAEGIALLQWARIVVDHVVAALAERTRVRLKRRGDLRPRSASLVIQDVRHALRTLARRPLFATAVITTIAFGVGANTAIFSVLHGIVLSPLPYPDAERVVSLGHEAPTWLTSEPEFLDYERGLHSFAALAAFTASEGNLATDEEPERIALASVTLDFFDALGVKPQLGRTFTAHEDLVMPAEVVLLSHDLWQRRYDGDTGVIGRTLMLNSRPRIVVGVMPPDFDYPHARTDIWMPIRRFHPDRDRANHYLFAVGRLRPGVSHEAATTEVRAVARRMMREHEDRYDPTYPLTPVLTRVSDALLGNTRPYLWALFGAVGFMLLIVCANVANLLLARGEGRRREIALRGALGASRARLIAQLLSESLLLSLAGGALGVLLAWTAQRGLLSLAPPALPRLDEIGLDATVLGYALAVSLLTGVLFGAAPAWRVSCAPPAEMLQQGGRGRSEGSSRRVRHTLVVAEVALAVVLLAGAGMLLRSLLHLQSAALGFEPRSVLTAKVSLTPGRYDDTQAIAFFTQVLERVRALPGVRAAGAAGWLPVVDAGGLWGVLAEGQSYDSLAQGPTAAPQQVTPGYFSTMGIHLLRGRDFTEHDHATGPYVAVVSEAMARALWPDADALGKRFRLGGGNTYMTVIGIAGDIRARGYADTPEPTMYFPFSQTATTAYFMPRSMTLVVRSAVPPLSLSTSVRNAVRSLDATVPVSDMRTLEQVVGTAVASRRFSTTLIALFALLALLLAGMGIFGVVAHGVLERTYEIGVRIALGAERANVLALVVADSTRMAAAGMLLGLLGAAAVARTIRSLLVDVPLLDVRTLLGACAALGVVVFVATVLPARRAAAVDPTKTLRAG